MSDPQMIAGIKAAVTIPVMAKARIGHFVEAQILQACEVDYIDESEVLTMADEDNHINKNKFTVPFVCGCRNLGEALRRITEGASMLRTKGEAGTGNVVEAVRHARTVQKEIKMITTMDEDELFVAAKNMGASYRRPSGRLRRRRGTTRERGRSEVGSRRRRGCRVDGPRGGRDDPWSRRRRGRRADRPRGRVAAPPRVASEIVRGTRTPQRPSNDDPHRYELLKQVAKEGRLPVVNFAAGGVATPADAALMMQLGMDGVFVGSGIFKSEDPAKRAKAIVRAVAHYKDPAVLLETSTDLGKAMVGICDVKGDAVNFRDREGGAKEATGEGIPKKRKLHGKTETQLYGSSWKAH